MPQQPTQRHFIREKVEVVYYVDIPEDVPLEDKEAYVCENQPPRSEWIESVEQRDIAPCN